jgi:hypothetical protein
MSAVKDWDYHTQRFNNRVRSLPESARDFFKDEASRLPGGPFDNPLSPEGGLRYHFCSYVFGATRSLVELTEATKLLWFHGRFISASVSIRQLIELWGGVEYALVVLDKYEKTKDLDVATKKMRALLGGSNTPVPWRPEVSNLKPINVMDFVRAAEAVQPGTSELYDFLCDASHPSIMQHMILLFAGPEYDNWSNDRFAIHADGVLDRTLEAGERSVRGIYRAGEDIMARCLPLALKELHAPKQ